MFRRIINAVKSFILRFLPSPDTDWGVTPPVDSSERIANGRKAEALLNDPMLCAVMEAVGAKYRLAWENAPRGDIEQQRTAHMSICALKDVQAALRAHLMSAKLYEADIAQKRKLDAAKSQY